MNREVLPEATMREKLEPQAARINQRLNAQLHLGNAGLYIRATGVVFIYQIQNVMVLFVLALPGRTML